MPPKKDPAPKPSTADKKASDSKRLSTAPKSPVKKPTEVAKVPEKDPEQVLAEILAAAKAEQRKAAEEAALAAAESTENVVDIITDPVIIAERFIESYLTAIDKKIPHSSFIHYFTTVGQAGFVFPGQQKIIGPNMISVALSVS